MKGQAVARSSTEMGYQAMTNKYGVGTKAIRNFKARYVYSEEDDATKEYVSKEGTGLWPWPHGQVFPLLELPLFQVRRVLDECPRSCHQRLADSMDC